jgi:hypothetical protein
MSQVAPGDNRARFVLLAAAGLAWALTMGQILRSEVLTRRDSADVRALVDSARLTRQHAAARYVVRAGETILGTFSSAVSGSRDEEQLAYVVEGELHAPVRARLKGIVVATWDRRPERLVMDLDLAGLRHRVDGALADGGSVLRIRYLAPGADPADALSWDIVDPPLLGPGPLPLPALQQPGEATPRSGRVEAPGTGETLQWALETPSVETITITGIRRRAHRHELSVRGVRLAAWLDDSGLPLRADLPGGITAELAEDSR